jgi:Glycosyl transferases group 1/Glycosyltransferase Family 4
MMQTEGVRLTVLNIANPFARVGADAPSGPEQILSVLDRALVAAGHTSLVAACEGSKVAGRLFPVPLPNREPIGEPERRWYDQQLRAVIDRALLLHCVDVVHMHSMELLDYEFPREIPLLVTLHTPISSYQAARLRRVANQVTLCCVSESLRRSLPPELRNIPVIDYGVELPSWRPNQRKGDFAAVLGGDRSGRDIALRAGTLAGTSVLVGDEVVPRQDRQALYSRTGVDARTHGGAAAPKHLMLGPVGAPQRRELLLKARCLLDLTRAPESRPLVAMEALASGTPVIAYRSGPLADIVEHGVTGFMVDNEGEMAEAIRDAGSLSPLACRRAAEKRFSASRMAERYFQRYQVAVSESAWEPVCA